MFYIDENATDENKVIEGVWRDYSSARLKIAGFESPKYAAKMAKLFRETGFLDDNGEVKQGKMYKAQHVAAYNSDPLYISRIRLKAIASSILVGWENVAFNRKDGEVAYSPENAFKFIDKNTSALEFIIKVASDEDGTTYDTMSADDKEEMGNLPETTLNTQSNIQSGEERQSQS